MNKLMAIVLFDAFQNTWYIKLTYCFFHIYVQVFIIAGFIITLCAVRLIRKKEQKKESQIQRVPRQVWKRTVYT